MHKDKVGIIIMDADVPSEIVYSTKHYRDFDGYTLVLSPDDKGEAVD